MQDTVKKKAEGFSIDEYMSPEKLVDHAVNSPSIWSHHETNCRRSPDDPAALVSVLSAIDFYAGDAMNFLFQILALDLDDGNIKTIAGELAKLSAHESCLRLGAARLLAKTVATNLEAKRILQKPKPVTYTSSFRDFIAELPYFVPEKE